MSKKVVFFLSSDRYPSPFDVLVLYDGGADAVVTYGNVSLEDTKSLVMDAMFPRGPKGIVDTTVFIGGKDVAKCEDMLKVVKKTMFPPFEIAIVFDPAGSCTTSAALVAKVARAVKDKLGGSLSGKKVTVLAGAGNVGSRAAHLFAKEGADVVIADLANDVAKKVAADVNEKVGAERVKVFELEKSDDSVYNACSGSEIVVSTAPPGVRTLSKAVLERLSECKLVADINAVPPEGIEGMKATADGDELVSGVFSVGPLSIGVVKLEVELKLVGEAISAQKGVFGYEEAYELAKKVVGI
ncbi:MAG: methylenetetrahydromethanopterin dehydrogenase, partial [Synergistetes bacterium]|nr:methylenetetrahydromethanopterin dehydrogenase [Synergistota bacterium]